MSSSIHPFKSSKNGIFFIAEIGGNHEGNFSYAKHLTKLALESGADAVKFQFYTGDSLVSKIESADRNAHFKKFELSNRQNIELLNIVRQGGGVPMASVWSKTLLEEVNDYLPFHKVGSGDLTCFPMLAALARTNKPIILATGLASLEEIADAVSYIDKCNSSYLNEKKLALLQCNSAYPTPPNDANIDVMLTLKKEFNLPVGFSDHTVGSEAIEVAVSVGAEIIEKHFTDSREGKSFRDHAVSITKDELRDTLQKIRHIMTLKGTQEKALTLSERESGHVISFRRAIYASRDIRAGETLTEENLTVLRPQHGISAKHFDDYLGRRITKPIKAFEALSDEHLADE